MQLSTSDLRYTGLTLEDVLAKDGLASPGDLLFTRYNGNPNLVGACARVPNKSPAVAYPDKLIRVSISPDKADSRFLSYAWAWSETQKQVRQHVKTTAGQAGISGSSLKSITLPIPPLPEQHRIVEALEGHLSRLDSAERELRTARKKVAAFRKSALLSLVPETVPDSWEMTTVGQAGSVGLGRQRHPDWHHGPEMHPYLRVANVFEDRIDTSDVMEMDFSGIFNKFRLEPGDVLLNEGQSPHLVGRPALYRGVPPNVAFTNSLLRFQAYSNVLPEWALIVFRRHLHARRFMREVRITTNIAHLSSKRLKAVEFPIPPIEEQKRLVQECDELMTNADAMERALERNSGRAKQLRKSVLNKAFTGNLVPQDPADEPASVLLDRIRAEREAQDQAKRGKPKRTPRPRATAATTAAAPAPTPAPRSAVQQEFQL
ncbi:restriction endonuclease subunit S [Streptomyces sp. NPDC059134]|uniref:restriction endonuclease subunit S n=1 Tax=Streptomyces sp. NPDC059134 TaxID=3346738 RepID=UPI003696A008